MKQVPTLTLDGYLDNVDLMMTKLFEYFVLSEYSQTKLFYTEIASLPYLIRIAGPDNGKLEDMVKSTLTTLYSRYWDNVTINTIITEENKNDSKSALKIGIEIEVIVNGKTYTLNKAAETDNGSVKSVDAKLDYFLGA